MAGGERRTTINGARLFARNFTLLIALGAFIMAVLDITAGQFRIGLAVMVVAVGSGTYRWRTDPKPRHHPDYSAIASMEREIYGKAFDHAGAPVLPVRGSALAELGDRMSLLGDAVRGSMYSLGECDCGISGGADGYRSDREIGKSQSVGGRAKTAPPPGSNLPLTAGPPTAAQSVAQQYHERSR